MGISGLLPQLKSISARSHVSKYRGQRAAVDAYVLLHRGAFTCPREIVEGEPSDKCTEYCMGRIQLLLGVGVVPVVVFDGGRLPNKAEEEKNRARSREENRAKARALWQQGNRTAAIECYQRAVDVTPAVAKGFIDALRQRGVEYIVAPYEADAQMAYLAINGLVDVVITEDSDLLTYGCPRVFFKMDKGGEGDEIELRNLMHARELSFLGFTHDMFQEMCILAGCDFVKGLPGIGIKKAHQQIRQRKSFIKVVKNLRFSGTPVPQDYEKRVQRAIWTFQHQRVFCPQRRAVVHLNEVQGGSLEQGAMVPAAAQLLEGEEDFLGPQLADDIAQAIAAGDLDPMTKQPYELPCTAPQSWDEPARSSQGGVAPARRSTHVQDGLRQIMQGLDERGPGQQQQRRQQQGQQKAKGGAAPVPPAGNTLAKYGFLRSSGSAMKEFRRPRMNGEPAAESEQQAPRPPQPHGFGGGADRQKQAFLQSLQAAGPAGMQCGGQAAASWQEPAGVAAGQAAKSTLAQPAGVAGLLAKLRGDLQGPCVEDLFQQRQEQQQQQQQAGSAEGPACSSEAAAEASPPQQQGQQEPHGEQRTPLEALGLQRSPTIDDLLTGGPVVIPESPDLSSGLVSEQPACLGPAGDTTAARKHKITPSFYGVPESEEQEGALPAADLLGSPSLGLEAGPAAEVGGDAIASLDHLEKFEREAKAAIHRAAAAAVRDSGMVAPPQQLQPPPYLQHQKQQHQQEQTRAAAALKRPFAVPRKAAANKENGVASPPGGKRSKAAALQPERAAANLFSRFACK